MSYQSGQEDRVREVRYSSEGMLQFTPRLYSNDTWSVSIHVKEFDQIEKYTNYVTCFFSQRNIAETEDGEYLMVSLYFVCTVRYILTVRNVGDLIKNIYK